MINTALTRNDYTKILSFISKLKEDENDFQFHILNLLHQIFRYNYSTFNLIDNNLNLFSPKVLNINEQAAEQYYQYYHKADIFRIQTKSNLNLFMTKKIISITDIMPMSRYENTEYYYDFIKKDTLYYQLTLPLKKRNRLIGGIGVFKQKSEGNFSTKDIAILSELNDFISDRLYLMLKLNNIKKDYQILNYCINETSSGIIVLDKNYFLLHANSIARKICKEIFNTDSLENSIKQLKNLLLLKFSSEMKISCSDPSILYKSYSFNISSSVISSIYSGVESIYIIFISKNDIKKPKNSINLSSKYNLTNRELEIIQLVRKGLSNKQIAQKLYISNHTVKTHMENIFKKLNVNNRTAALYKINA